MNHKYTFLFTYFLLFFVSLMTFGQDEYLHFNSKCKDSVSPFTKVNVIDKRSTEQTLGFVQIGGFNRIARVKFTGNLPDSLAAFFKNSDSTKMDGSELAISLYELYLSEKEEGFTETGRLKLCMRIFEKTREGNFAECYAIDSIYKFQAIDVTVKLMNSVSEHLCEISQSLIISRNDTFLSSKRYTYEELINLDSIEKLEIPIYTTTKYKCGIFANYDQFKMNLPETSIIEIDTSNCKNIKVYKYDSGKTNRTRLDNHSCYAVSDGNIVLKATAIGFYKLEKINSDFYFDGQTSFSNANNVAMWTLAAGMIGAAVASGAERNYQRFRFKINYRKGNSVLISKAID